MKRTRLNRSKPPKRRGELKRGKAPENSRKSRSAARRRRERDRGRRTLQFHSDEFVEFVQALPCRRCGAVPSEVHHDPQRGNGGTWEDTSPLCRACHTSGPRARHGVGTGVVTFWTELGMTYEESNARTQEQWRARYGTRENYRNLDGNGTRMVDAPDGGPA